MEIVANKISATNAAVRQVIRLIFFSSRTE